MAATSRSGSPPTPLQQPGRVRRAFHLLLAGSGWLLFAYWWWLVLGRTGDREIAWTIAFVVLSLIVVVIVTGLWVWHNLALARRRLPRFAVREVEEKLDRDALGRPLRVVQEADDMHTAPVVHVAIENGSKVYRTGGRPETLRRRLAGVAGGSQ